MDSTSRHRGPDPEDERAFGPRRLPVLRKATEDLCWLLDRGYGVASANELVGDRYRLSRRQRIAIARCSCPGPARERRESHRLSSKELREQDIWIDGFNVLTALETAFGGGVILIGRDECCRDVAGVYSHYHRVAETLPALRAVGQFAVACGAKQCCWWLDSPVDNSRRLKALIQKVAADAGWTWPVELVTNPDHVLSSTDRIVCSSDHVILDRCVRWFNLSREVIARYVPLARVLNLWAGS